MTEGHDRQFEEGVVAAPLPGDTHRGVAKAGRGFVLNRAGWALASFGGTLAIKLGLNMVLSRLLAPEIFGIMVVITALRVGIELLTDVGIESNIVHNDRGLEPDFFNTAWTMQIVRGVCLTLLFLALSPLAASFYAIDMRVFMVISFAPLLNALHSTSVFAAVKQLEVKQRNIFEFTSEFINFALCCIAAWISPTIWSLLGATLVAVAARSVLSYRLPHPAHRLLLRREHVMTILRYGRWIAVASLVTYAASYIDRLTLGRVAPLALLGIYGLARTIAELPATLSQRLSYQVVFPLLAANRDGESVLGLSAARFAFLLGGSVCLATVSSWSDWAVHVLYDERYRAAGPMLSLLMIAAWFSVMATLNEGLVLGSGRPGFIGAAGVVRVVVLIVALPAGYASFGFAGAIGAVILGEVARYSAVVLGQRSTGQAFYAQDALATLAFVIVLAAWAALRHMVGLDLPWLGGMA